MSIRSDVMDAIREFGANGATYMEVHQVIKGRHTEQQIRVALHRLSHGGWLRWRRPSPRPRRRAGIACPPFP
jgi:DNA-binding transcriptional regulator PaaX